MECRPPASIVLSLAGLGYKVLKSSPGGILLHNSEGESPPIAATLDAPHFILGYKTPRGFRVFKSRGIEWPVEWVEACIYSPGLDGVKGVGRVRGNILEVLEGRPEVWDAAYPANPRHEDLLDNVSRHKPVIIALTRWYSTPNPCNTLRELAGYTPFQELLPSPCTGGRFNRNARITHGI
ncbi:MAG: hypothetical protein GSR86_06765 [Desulfurococcales archaeon]|nr:hypothetical protein [Desulfurococcales archaeon]